MRKLFCITLAFLLLFTMTALAHYNYAISPEYDSCSDFTGGIALVYKDGQSGVIDKAGNYILPFDSTPKCIRKNGLVMVLGENGMAAFFDASGKQVTDYIYDAYAVTHPKTEETSYRYFTNMYDGDGSTDLIPISRDKKFGFLNAKGEEQIAPQFEYVYGFHDGCARICAEGVLSEYATYTNGKYGFIRADGTTIVPANTYWVASDFQHGYASVANGYTNLMLDKNGTVQDLGGYSYMETNGIYITVADAEGRTAVLDMQKQLALPFDTQTKDLLGESIILGRKHIVDRTGTILYTAPENGAINPKYTQGGALTNFATIHVPAGDVTGHNYTGLIDYTGRIVLQPIYETVSILGEGLIYAQTLTENLLLDYNGYLICTLNGNYPGYCNDGLFSLVNFDTMKKGYVKNPLRDIPVLYDGAPIAFTDASPLLENGRTLVPLRAIFETLGATVGWDDATFTVTAIKDDIEIKLTIGESVLYRNGEAIVLDTYARLENSRTLVPLRAVSEAFNCKVDWDGGTRTVSITE